jgi:hypothetical protein
MIALVPVAGFPLPNDVVDGRVVVASVTYVDDLRGELALVLLLEKQPPYFTVAHYAVTDFDPHGDPDVPDDGPAHKAGDLVVLAREWNIVPALDAYQENGGEY